MLELFKRVEGLPIWKAENSHGSMAIIEIGKPHLEIRSDLQPKRAAKPNSGYKDLRVFAAGKYSLHIWDCDWEVRSGKELVGGVNSTESVRKALKFIEGRFIQEVNFHPRKRAISVGFEHGIKLIMKPFDHLDDQWFLYSNLGKRWVLYSDEHGYMVKERLTELVAMI